MPRYIDADELYKKIYPLDLVDKRLYTINAKAVADAIAKTPAADVVPRAEVEKAKNAAEKWKDNLKAVLEERAETKQEAAREIFAEINAIKKEYVSGDIDGNELYVRLYMLEKKYTEGE